MKESCSGKKSHPYNLDTFIAAMFIWEKSYQQRSRMLWLFTLTELIPLGELEFWYREKLALLGGWPYRQKRVTRQQGEIQLFVSRVNGSPRFVRNCMNSWLAQGSFGSEVILEHCISPY